MKIKLLLEYDGSSFAGWQRQVAQLSVQQELEQGLEVYLGSEAKQQGVVVPSAFPVTGSGRTDAGVHAAGQVASFEWPEQLDFDAGRLREALNGITNRGLAIVAVAPVADSFDARRSRHCKCYSYTIHNHRAAPARRAGSVWHISGQLDISAMIAAAGLLVGTHDFKSFQAADCAAKNSVRTITRSELIRSDTFELQYRVQGNGFLKQMVRTIVGTLVEIGQGKRSVSELETILNARDRTLAGATAPAKGLVLEWVRYDSP